MSPHVQLHGKQGHLKLPGMQKPPSLTSGRRDVWETLLALQFSQLQEVPQEPKRTEV